MFQLPSPLSQGPRQNPVMVNSAQKVLFRVKLQNVIVTHPSKDCVFVISLCAKPVTLFHCLISGASYFLTPTSSLNLRGGEHGNNRVGNKNEKTSPQDYMANYQKMGHMDIQSISK